MAFIYKSKLVRGVGVNDAKYKVRESVSWREGGKLKIKSTWLCPFYEKWSNMIDRCYGESNSINRQPYKDCTVCEEWLTFSNFRSWMITQEWEGKHLDKDLLFTGNKTYSPESCVFISRYINSFILTQEKNKGEYPSGVSLRKDTNKFHSTCQDPFKRKKIHLGYFNCQNEAHLAWKSYKHKLSIKYAELQTDSRIKKALMERYL